MPVAVEKVELAWLLLFVVEEEVDEEVELEDEEPEVFAMTVKVKLKLQSGAGELGSSCRGLLPFTAWNSPAKSDFGSVTAMYQCGFSRGFLKGGFW